METPTRVLVAGCQRFIRELILSTLADQPDIEVVVGEVIDESEILGTSAA